MRAGLREMLSTQPDIELRGEVLDLNSVNEGEVDVALFAPASQKLVLPSPISCAILLMTDNAEDVRRLMNSTDQAWGVLSSGASGEELVAAVRALGEGLWVGHSSMVSSLMRSTAGTIALEEEALIEPLTAREMEVIQWMALGLANKQIALKLGISEHTVKFHLSALYAKLNCSSRTEAVRRGVELGLITL